MGPKHKSAITPSGAEQGVQTRETMWETVANGQKVIAKLTSTSRVLEGTVPSVTVHAFFLIDASGSMLCEVGDGSTETRFDLTLQYVQKLMEDGLAPTDTLTVAFFNSKYHQVIHDHSVTLVLTKLEKIKKEGKQHLADYGVGTNLYDFTSKALGSMKKSEAGSKDEKGNIRATDSKGSTILRTMVVFTDGADSGSRKQLSQMVEELKRPGFGNFHFVGLVAGADTEAEAMIKAFKGVDHAKIIPVTDCSSQNIKKLFGLASDQMRATKSTLVETLSLFVVNDSKNPKSAIASVVQQIGGNISNGGLQGNASVPALEQNGRSNRK